VAPFRLVYDTFAYRDKKVVGVFCAFRAPLPCCSCCMPTHVLNSTGSLLPLLFPQILMCCLVCRNMDGVGLGVGVRVRRVGVRVRLGSWLGLGLGLGLCGIGSLV
jgi:hypothetical protein